MGNGEVWLARGEPAGWRTKLESCFFATEPMTVTSRKILRSEAIRRWQQHRDEESLAAKEADP
jgi:hypothetical protein